MIPVTKHIYPYLFPQYYFQDTVYAFKPFCGVDKVGVCGVGGEGGGFSMSARQNVVIDGFPFVYS